MALSTGNVAVVTKELNFKLYLILNHLNLKNRVWPGASVLDNTAEDSRIRMTDRSEEEIAPLSSVLSTLSGTAYVECPLHYRKYFENEYRRQ